MWVQLRIAFSPDLTGVVRYLVAPICLTFPAKPTAAVWVCSDDEKHAAPSVDLDLRQVADGSMLASTIENKALIFFVPLPNT